jgi:hypothetical protein
MVVGFFDLWLGMVVGAAIIPFILITDTIFSVNVTFIFLKPILDLLQAARGTVRTAAKERLERTKRWNFAGLILTVVSSTALYLHVIAFFVLSVLHQYYLHSSVFGNPYALGVPTVSMLNTVGMILLCGMFKDTVLPSHFVSVVVSSKKVGLSAGERRQELGFIIDSHAYSEQAAMCKESS